MKSSNIIPIEIKDYFIDDKTGVFKEQDFQWKVDLTYIHRLRPNLKKCSNEVFN